MPEPMLPPFLFLLLPVADEAFQGGKPQKRRCDIGKIHPRQTSPPNIFEIEFLEEKRQLPLHEKIRYRGLKIRGFSFLQVKDKAVIGVAVECRQNALHHPLPHGLSEMAPFPSILLYLGLSLIFVEKEHTAHVAERNVLYDFRQFRRVRQDRC